MKQIQDIVPQNTASRKSHSGAPGRRPDPAPGAQIRGQNPAEQAKQRGAAKQTQRQAGADKKARGRVRRGGTGEGIDSIPYPAGEDRA